MVEQRRTGEEPIRGAGPEPVHSLHAAWSAACEQHPTRPAQIVIGDAREIVTGIAELLHATSPTRAQTERPTRSAIDSIPDASPTLVVAQLLVLRTVARAWLQHEAPAARFVEMESRLLAAVDDAVLAVMTRSLDELERAAFVDPLTGLLNRRAADRDLERAVTQAQRHGRLLTVVMLDVDDLKGTNDRLGHAAGDAALRGLAHGLTAMMRAGDNAYRVGGDEFMVILPDLHPEAIASVIERTAVGASSAFTWGSAGLPNDSGSAASLLALADLRLLAHRAARGAGPADPVRGTAPTASTVAATDSRRASRDLQTTNRDRLVIEQAKGVVAQWFGVPPEHALVVLHDYAQHHLVPLAEVAAALVHRTMSASDLVGHIEPIPAHDGADHPA